HYGNFKEPYVPSNLLTVLALDSNQRQTFTLGSPPLGVAFGIDNRAFIVTRDEFLLLDPVTGATQVLQTIAGATSKELPVPGATWPTEIIRASVAPSADGMWVIGIAELATQAQPEPQCSTLAGVTICVVPPPITTDNGALVVTYNVNTKQVIAQGWIASPPLGPRAMSVARDGSTLATGWGVFTRGGILLAQFRDAAGVLATGSVALDSAKGLIYGQVTRKTQAATPTPAPGQQGSTPAPGTPEVEPPVLVVADADNLTVRERLRLPENLAGKAVLSSNGEVMYAVSSSGLAILPVGTLARLPRVAASQEDVVFRGSFCDRRVMTQEIDIVDPGGGRTDFSLEISLPGVTVSPASGVTPARVRVSIDPNAFQNEKGTTAGTIQILSQAGVNIPFPVRVLINSREPDQRGSFFNAPGKLVDILADPGRNRFYVLRQDKNQVLVYDGANYRLLRTLRTGNTPTQMAMTLDRQLLLVGADDSQIVHVYNLDTMEMERPIVMPSGHYPRSLAAAGRAILVASRVAGPKHLISRADMYMRIATALPTLGVYENNINIDTMLAGTPSGAGIFAVQGDGNVMLYDANADTFAVSRKDFTKLSGAYAALSDERFVVDNNLLNGALAPIQRLETASGSSSGFALVNGQGVRTTAPTSDRPGVVQRVDLAQGTGVRPTRMTEAPLLSEALPGAVFRRTLGALPASQVLVSLTTSGFTVLPYQYDAAVADPRIERVASFADASDAVAPGGLITITGRDLSVVNAATREIPLPTALADSCLTVNGVLVPMVLVSPTQINGQLPFAVSGSATMILRTPGGVSNSFRFGIQGTAPTVFRSGVAGEDRGIPTVVRALNGQLVTLSNPIHPEDSIVIYATGMGVTAPAVRDGYPGPADPLAEVLVEPEVTLGGEPLPIVYAGLAPGQVGVYQINAEVPYWVPLGMELPLTIKQGSYSTTLNVRVVK
ncbi:MAG: hypothetical protein AAB225_10375, partial [Acidobacteriota bacterium]